MIKSDEARLKSLFDGRVTGLIVVEIVDANINGDPDNDGAPRIREDSGIAEMTAAAVKAKIRKVIADKSNSIWTLIKDTFGFDINMNFEVFEQSSRTFEDGLTVAKTGNALVRFADIRMFGGMFKPKKENDTGGFTYRGPIQFGLGKSIARVDLAERTQTRQTAVEAGKTRGMAPMANKSLHHAVMVIPFYICPNTARQTGLRHIDVEVLKMVLPLIFSSNRSSANSGVHMLHCHWCEHKNQLGSAPDHLILRALTPTKEDVDSPSTSIDDYKVPSKLSGDLAKKVNHSDLCEALMQMA